MLIRLSLAVLLIATPLSAQHRNNDQSLIRAAENGDSQLAARLIGEGADPNARDSGGATPLLYAVKACDVSTMKLLLDKGADVRTSAKQVGRVQYKSSEGPVWIALLSSCPGAIPLVAPYGADVNLTTSDGYTPLMFAIASNYTVAVPALLAAGADVNLSSREGITAMYLAAEIGDAETVKMLAARGANVNAATKAGITPLMHAVAMAPNVYVARTLIALGADPKPASALAAKNPTVKAGLRALFAEIESAGLAQVIIDYKRNLHAVRVSNVQQIFASVDPFYVLLRIDVADPNDDYDGDVLLSVVRPHQFNVFDAGKSDSPGKLSAHFVKSATAVGRHPFHYIGWDLSEEMRLGARTDEVLVPIILTVQDRYENAARVDFVLQVSKLASPCKQLTTTPKETEQRSMALADTRWVFLDYGQRLGSTALFLAADGTVREVAEHGTTTAEHLILFGLKSLDIVKDRAGITRWSESDNNVSLKRTGSKGDETLSAVRWHDNWLCGKGWAATRVSAPE